MDVCSKAETLGLRVSHACTDALMKVAERRGHIGPTNVRQLPRNVCTMLGLECAKQRKYVSTGFRARLVTACVISQMR